MGGGTGERWARVLLLLRQDLESVSRSVAGLRSEETDAF
jgi:hypothetical protein